MLRPVELMDFPVELICHILSFLNDEDLINCTVLAKKLRTIILHSSQLQYMIELAKHRMICLLPSSAELPYVARLKILRDREHAWKTLTWKARYHLKLPPTGSVYEFVGGLYGNGKEDDRRVTASISFLELPSGNSSDASDLKMWTHPTPDVTIIDFTMDPSQDLLVLIVLAPPGLGYIYELHLRSLSTNEPHPKATLHKLPCLVKPSNTHPTSEHIAAVRVQVSGELVALLVKEVYDGCGAHLEIWDWINKPQISCKITRTLGIDDFTFLSRDAFLLVRPSGNFEVYTFRNPISEDTVPVCQVSYAFPPLSQGYSYWYITMSSNPTPGSIPRPSSNSNTEHGRERQIYYPKPDERIHACCLYIFNPTTDDLEHRIHCFVFFVNIQSLLRPPAEWIQESRPRNKANRSKASSSFSLGANTTTDPGQYETPLSHGNGASPDNSNAFSKFHPPSTSPFGPHPEHNYALLSPAGSTLASSSSRVSAPLVFNAPSMPFPSQSLHMAPEISPGPPRPSPPSLPTASPANIPWAVWGPQSTRWFPECLSTDWQHSIYGLRTVESVTPEKLLFPHAHVPMPPLSPIPLGPLFEEMDVHLEGGSVMLEAAEIMDSAAMPSTSSVELLNFAPTPILDVVTAPPPSASSSVPAETDSDSAIPWRYLRLRDYNPYSVMEQLREDEDAKGKEKDKKGKGKINWRVPHVVVDPSTINVRGVFKYDVTSWLPYVEVVSEEMFEMTDVMMDDCRLLLLKRNDSGRLKQVDVLTM